MSVPINEILAQIIKNVDLPESVNLTPGQIISLLVKQIEGSQALLTYQGKFLLAQLEAPLNPGERIRCRVEGEQDGRVLLKVLPDSSRLSGESGSRGITTLLQEIGLPVTEKNLQIVRELVSQELPVNRENLQSVSQLARKTGAAPADLDVLTLIYKQGIPVTAKNFELFRAAFKEPDFLSAPLENLRQQLSDMVRQLPVNSEQRILGEKVIGLLEKMIINQGHGPGQAQAILADAPRTLGLLMGQTGYQALAKITAELPPAIREQFLQNVLAGKSQPSTEIHPTGASQLIQSNAAQQSTGTPQSTGASQPTLIQQPTGAQRPAEWTGDGAINGEAGTVKQFAVQNRLPDDVRVIKDTLHIKGDAAPRDALHVEDNLPALLDKLQAFIRGESVQEKAVQTIINTVQERLNTLEILQRPAGPNQEGIFLLQSMFQTDEKNYPLEMLVKYRQEEQGKNIDFSRCHVFVTLTTGRLGTVQAAVRLNGRNLECRFTTESEKARQTIGKWLPDLMAKLTQLEYNVTMLPGRVRTDDPPPALAPVTDRNGIYQVDITV